MTEFMEWLEENPVPALLLVIALASVGLLKYAEHNAARMDALLSIAQTGYLIDSVKRQPSPSKEESPQHESAHQ